MQFNFQPLDFSNAINYHQHKYDGINSALQNASNVVDQWDNWATEKKKWDNQLEQQKRANAIQDHQLEQADKKFDTEMAQIEENKQKQENFNTALENLKNNVATDEKTNLEAKQKFYSTADQRNEAITNATSQNQTNLLGQTKEEALADKNNGVAYDEEYMKQFDTVANDTANDVTKNWAGSNYDNSKLNITSDPMYQAALAEAENTGSMQPVYNYFAKKKDTEAANEKYNKEWEHKLEREAKSDDFQQQGLDLQKKERESNEKDQQYVTDMMKKLSGYDFGMLSPRDKQILTNWKNDKTGNAKKTLEENSNILQEMYNDAVQKGEFELAAKIKSQYAYYDALLNPMAIRQVMR